MAMVFAFLLKDIWSCAAGVCDQGGVGCAGTMNASEKGYAMRRAPAGHVAVKTATSACRMPYASAICDHQLAKEHLYVDRAVPDAQHPSSGCNQVSHTQHRLDYSGYSYQIAGICLHASIDKA